MANKKNVLFKLSVEDHHRLRIAAARADKSMSQFVRDITLLGVEISEDEVRANALAEAAPQTVEAEAVAVDGSGQPISLEVVG